MLFGVIDETNLPSYNNEKVQSIPRISQVRPFSIDTHGQHLYGHFDGEKGKYEIIKYLKQTKQGDEVYSYATIILLIRESH